MQNRFNRKCIFNKLAHLLEKLLWLSFCFCCCIANLWNYFQFERAAAQRLSPYGNLVENELKFGEISHPIFSRTLYCCCCLTQLTVNSLPTQAKSRFMYEWLEGILENREKRVECCWMKEFIIFRVNLIEENLQNFPVLVVVCVRCAFVFVLRSHNPSSSSCAPAPKKKRRARANCFLFQWKFHPFKMAWVCWMLPNQKRMKKPWRM